MFFERSEKAIAEPSKKLIINQIQIIYGADVVVFFFFYIGENGIV